MPIPQPQEPRDCERGDCTIHMAMLEEIGRLTEKLAQLTAALRLRSQHRMTSQANTDSQPASTLDPTSPTQETASQASVEEP